MDSKKQSNLLWKGKKCAVCLTYDDGLNVHIDNVVPVLDSHGFKATFYIHGTAISLNEQIPEWREIAANGHELGNHTLFHPCSKTPKNRDWVSDDYNLDNYTLLRITDEIKIANVLLNAIDGKSVRTHAYSCGELKINNNSYVDSIKSYFSGARGVTDDLRTLNDIDLYNIGAIVVIDQPAEELIEYIKNALKDNVLAVFIFHGIGGEHHLNYPIDKHNKLLEFIKANEKDIWIAPLVEITKYISEYRNQL